MADDQRPVMLITGASRGIGAAVAIAAAETYDLVLNYVSDSTAANAVVDAIGERCRPLLVQADVGDESAIVRMFAELDERFGRIDVLINNAGIAGGHGELASVTAEMLDRLFA